MGSPNVTYVNRPSFRVLVATVVCAVVSGCINPLGPIGKGPEPAPPRSSPRLSQKFAWGISTSSYQYEDPAVKPGDKDYFYSDWDILIERRKAPPERQCSVQLDALR